MLTDFRLQKCEGVPPTTVDEGPAISVGSASSAWPITPIGMNSPCSASRDDGFTGNATGAPVATTSITYGKAFSESARTLAYATAVATPTVSGLLGTDTVTGLQEAPLLTAIELLDSWAREDRQVAFINGQRFAAARVLHVPAERHDVVDLAVVDRKSTRLNSSHT